MDFLMPVTLFLAFATAAMVAYAVIPVSYDKVAVLSQRRASRLSVRLERIVPRKRLQVLAAYYMAAPFVLGGGAFVLIPPDKRLVGVILFTAIGLAIPSIYTKILIDRNSKKFDNQLLDALMIMSSSFRGGLSLIQAMEAVTEEMPDPISLEFLTVLGENKMGVVLDEALNHLYNRMPSSALQQMITAILLARETGGNLPMIFQRIVSVIREQKRVMGQIATLTLQGKIQGAVMSMLPIVFYLVIYSANPTYFDYMFTSPTGRLLLVYAVLSELAGIFLILKISALKDF